MIGKESSDEAKIETVGGTVLEERCDCSQGALMNRDRLSTTVVICVEAGSLEHQAARLVESLRRWGGELQKVPVLAIKPRIGPPLSKSTLAIFDKNDAQYVSRVRFDRFEWHQYLNKAYILQWAEELVTTDCITYMDCDLLVTGNADQWLLATGEEFAASAPDKNIGLSGCGDDSEAYWLAVLRVLDLSVDELPWIVTGQEGLKVRLLWNAGLYTYRRSTRFSAEWLNCCRKVLDARVAHKDAGAHHVDQIVLGLAQVRLGLKYRAVPHSYNYQMEGWSGIKRNAASIREAKIIHYHNAMDPAPWPSFLAQLENTHPEVFSWLRAIGPLPQGLPPHWNLARYCLRALRASRRRMYVYGCSRY
jgi:hypothetical protein